MLVQRIEKTIQLGTKVRVKHGGYGYVFATGLAGTVVNKPDDGYEDKLSLISKDACVFIKVENVGPQHYCYGKIIGLPQICSLIIEEDGKTEETPNAQKG